MLEVQSDLFALDVDAYAHGCNAMGKMGAGIAKQFADRYPEMFKAYKAACDTKTVELGNVLPWRDPVSGRWIYNLITQFLPGPNADPVAIYRSLTIALDHARSNGVHKIGMPRIGTGIGGLSWQQAGAAISMAEQLVPDGPTVMVAFL